MDSMSTAEIIETILLLESSIDVQFQIWITVTFAMVVAAYISSGKLARNIRILIGTLYGLVIFALFMRWMTDGLRAMEFVAELENRGINFTPLSDISPTTRIIAFISGSATALYLIYYFEKNHNKKA